MKKLLAIILSLVTLFCLASCKKQEPPTQTGDYKVAYIEFLKNEKEKLKIEDGYYFYLRDLDNNKVPELLVQYYDGKAETQTFSVYSFNEEIYKIGDLNSDLKKSSLHLSDNEKFYGIYYTWYDNMVRHYGYLTLKNNKLKYQNLGYISWLFNGEHIITLSAQKELLEDAKETFPDPHAESWPLKNMIIFYTIKEKDWKPVDDFIEKINDFNFEYEYGLEYYLTMH